MAGRALWRVALRLGAPHRAERAVFGSGCQRFSGRAATEGPCIFCSDPQTFCIENSDFIISEVLTISISVQKISPA